MVSLHSPEDHFRSDNGPERSAQEASNATYDLVGVGFGPANLAIAIALTEAYQNEGRPKPRILFLEQQRHFAWHEGMLLPGTKMQISFIKDLATMRNPQSQFTFLNYLKQHNRLVQFSNLDTFLPQRREYQDYLKWCAGHFEDIVSYGTRVSSISPVTSEGLIRSFKIAAVSAGTGQTETVRARRIVISVGGRPRIPAALSAAPDRVVHSSQYAQRINTVLPSPERRYRILVIGGGQSGAEIFNDLHSRYPNSQTTLMIKDTSLRPSDDSPFVNEVFDPERVDGFFSSSAENRALTLSGNKATNYAVVRLGLLEHLYAKMYDQRFEEPDPAKWQHRILTESQVVSADASADDSGGLRVQYTHAQSGGKTEEMAVDAVITATGYARDVHERMLDSCRQHMPAAAQTTGRCQVSRDYRIQFRGGAIDENAGVWLQGCNEETHGLGDTLLSILAVRGGEMVDSLFKDWTGDSQEGFAPRARL